MTDSNHDVVPTAPFNDPCVVYKPLVTHGGLERYVAELAQTLGAPIYTEEQSIDPFVGERTIDVIEFESDGGGTGLFARGSIRQILQYENFTVPERHDAVITVGEVSKAVIHQPDQRRYHMLNMPPRWLFDRGPGRFTSSVPGVGTMKRLYQSALRVHDISTVSRIDDFVVPSEIIGRRLQTYYDREPTAVIYPPVDTEQYYYEADEGYFLIVGRLSPNKRVDELVDWLSETGHEVKIAGTGPEEASLKRRAADNIEFLGYVQEERKRDLLANCHSLVFNGDREAFGIVPVEALASGKPVVGVDDGFTKYQIDEGVNGTLFQRTEESFVDAIERLQATDWNPAAIEQTAETYDIDRFRDHWRSLIET